MHMLTEGIGALTIAMHHADTHSEGIGALATTMHHVDTHSEGIGALATAMHHADTHSEGIGAAIHCHRHGTDIGHCRQEVTLAARLDSDYARHLRSSILVVEDTAVLLWEEDEGEMRDP